MAQLIDKDALVAEIEKIIADETESIKSFEHSKNVSEVQRSNARICVLMHLRSLLNTLEVKVTDEVKIGETQIYLEDDGGEPPYDGKQWLDLSCTEYESQKPYLRMEIM